MQTTDLLSFLRDHANYDLNEYYELLSHLSICPPLDSATFHDNLNTIMSMGTIIVAHNDQCIVGSGTVIIEPKIIRGGKCVGHIEDIVVHPKWRGNNIAGIILQKLREYAESKNCYKIILDCTEIVSKVYVKNGFNVSGVFMSKYM